MSYVTLVRTAAIQIEKEGKLVVRLLYDGSVDFGEGITPTEAAKEFWKELAYLIKTCP